MSTVIYIIIVLFFVKRSNMYIIIIVFYCIIFIRMTPNQTPIWSLNIDQMLQKLSTTPQKEIINPITEENLVSNESKLWTIFSIENISKPISSTVSHTPKEIVNKLFFSFRGVRTIASVISTFFLIVLWGFVVSKQYPIETEQFANKVFGIINTIVITTEKNTQPDTIVIENTLWSWNEIHNAAPDNYITNTPLSDAITQSQNNLTQDTPNDEILSTVAGEINNTTPSSSSSTYNTEWASEWTSTDIVLPSVSKKQTNEELKWKLLILAQSAEEAMTNLIGNSDVKMAKMRAVYKKSQALIIQISDNTFVYDAAFIDQITQLQSLYDSTIVQ